MKAEIKWLAIQHDLQVGKTTPNIDCPFCKSGEKSFSMTRTPAGIVYNCFRAKCSARGFVPLMPHTITDGVKEKKFEPYHFSYPLRNFSDEELSKYFSKYELSPTLLRENGFRYDYTNGRVFMPINSYESFRIGAVAKKLPNSAWQGPKAVAYWLEDHPKIHFADIQVRIPQWCCIVEDIISSVKVSQFMECAALLGTHLPENSALELRKYFQNIIVALDPGAEDKALSIVEKYKLFFKNVRVATLQKDPKDTPYEELKGAILGTIGIGSTAKQTAGVQ